LLRAYKTHDPAVQICQHVRGKIVAAWVLTKGHGTAGGMQEAQIATDIPLGIRLALSTSGKEARQPSQRVDMSQRTVACWHWTAKCGDAGELTGMIPGNAQGHRSAAANAGEKDSLGMDVEAAARNLDAREDA
jgi:hypothetical protein